MIWTLAIKDLRLLLRDPVGLFFATVFPLAFGVLFGLIYAGGGGGGGEIDVLALDADGSETSAAFLERLDDSDAIAIEVIENEDDGRRRVRLGEATAFIIVPQGYESAIKGVFAGEAIPPITGAIDPARVAEAGVLQGVSIAAGFQVMTTTLADLEVLDETLERAQTQLREADNLDVVSRGLFSTMISSGRSLAQRAASDANEDDGDAIAGGLESGASIGFGGFNPVALELESIARETGGKPRSAFEITFPQAAAWAVLGCVAGFGMSLVRERAKGTMLRLAVAPLPRHGIVLGKALACFLLTVAVLVVLQVAGAMFFGIRVHAWWSATAAVLSTAFGFVGLMMFLSSISQTEGGAEGFVRAMLLVMALIGGAGMPLFFMPDWMQAVSGVSPFRWAILALEGASFRGYSPSEMMTPCGVLLGMGLVGFGVSFFLFRRWSVS
ncbi:MAG: ABC transporter permease [Planctomycetota bacterium]